MYVQVRCILLFRMTEKRCMVYLLQCRPVLTLKKYVAECSLSCGTEGGGGDVCCVSLKRTGRNAEIKIKRCALFI